MNSELPSTVAQSLGPAAEKLADTVRHVVDLVAGSDRIIAKAQAQAHAELILAEGRAQKQDIEARAIDRLRKREARRQNNIESITVKALKALPPPEQLSEQPVSEDWTSRFFEECQDISDVEMQQIWARILAGEVARPGSFAPHTLSVVRDLTKNDANLFTKVCGYVWRITDTETMPVIHSIEMPEFVNTDIDFGSLTHLTTIGLIEYDHIAGYEIKKPATEIAVSYFGAVHQLKSDGGQERRLSLGHVIFTAVGNELLGISGAQKNDEYCRATLNTWSKAGWKEA
ncbi:MAG: DUF2806 domain-containing protein [Rhizobiales bacterium]|nr:DUF2806 domain-containing protein [Hyphomicrobiales bacterium]